MHSVMIDSEELPQSSSTFPKVTAFTLMYPTHPQIVENTTSTIKWITVIFFAQRQKCGTAEIERSKRSERGTLSAVATTVIRRASLLI